jgi:hypothetical protein
MKKVVLLIILLHLSPGGYSQNPGSVCCRGLAPSNPGSIRLPMISKAPLDVRQECPDGTALRAISFSHKSGEILTYQESFGLTCASSASMVTNQCSWGQLIPNSETRTWALALAGSIVTGVRFTHSNARILPTSRALPSERASCKIPDQGILVLEVSPGPARQNGTLKAMPVVKWFSMA